MQDKPITAKGLNPPFVSDSVTKDRFSIDIYGVQPQISISNGPFSTTAGRKSDTKAFMNDDGNDTFSEKVGIQTAASAADSISVPYVAAVSMEIDEPTGLGMDIILFALHFPSGCNSCISIRLSTCL